MSGFYQRMGWYDAEGNLMMGCLTTIVLAGLGVAVGLFLIGAHLL